MCWYFDAYSLFHAVLPRMANFLLAIAFTLHAAIFAAAQECGEHRMYKQCGSMCPDYCGKPDDVMCPDVCVSGCFCESGYILEAVDSNKCIPREACQTCDVNKQYFTCGSMCPEYCGQPDHVNCLDVCVSGCFCKPGYLLAAEDSELCIPKENCECDKHEQYNPCGTMCPDYCGKPTGTMCPTVCVPGCFCEPGYILISVNGTCIPDTDCPV